MVNNDSCGASDVEMSPSGKYTLCIESTPTKPGCWNVTRGTVRAADGREIAVVDRNYSSFPYLFVEGHPDGHDYLVCGANYQGQTVIRLDTGERRDHVPEAAKAGAGFCWVDYSFDVASRLLVVNGCVWAAPFEYRFYDFSDPMSGWPELDSGSEGIWSDSKAPEILPDGSIRCFDTTEPDVDEEEGAPAPGEVNAIRTFRRDGLKLVLADEWVSDAEKKRRADREEGWRRWETWLADFKANDPLFLAYREMVKDPALTPSDYESHGVTYAGWAPGFKTEETRWCRRIVQRERDAKGPTIDLEWGAKTGPIKLDVFKDGAGPTSTFYPHSVDGMREAFARALAVVAEHAATEKPAPASAGVTIGGAW